VGCSAASVSSLIATFRDTGSVLSSRVKIPMIVHYRRFGAPYRRHRQGSRSPCLFITDVSGHRIGPIFKDQDLYACSLPTFGTPYRRHRQESSYPCLYITDVSGHCVSSIFKGQDLHACSLPTFRDTVSASSSRAKISTKKFLSLRTY